MISVQPLQALGELKNFFLVKQSEYIAESLTARAKTLITSGKNSLDQYLSFRHDGIIIGGVFINKGPAPLIPRLEIDPAIASGLEFFDSIRDAAKENNKIILVRSTIFDLSESIDYSQYTIEDHEYSYKTDLKNLTICPKSSLGVRFIEYKMGQDIPEYLTGAVKDSIKPDGDALVDIDEMDLVIAYIEEEVVGCATLNHNNVDVASIKMIGIRKDLRGRGIGRMLHHRALSLASDHYEVHVGTTNVSNEPMIRIFEANGSIRTSEDRYLRSL